MEAVYTDKRKQDSLCGCCCVCHEELKAWTCVCVCVIKLLTSCAPSPAALVVMCILTWSGLTLTSAGLCTRSSISSLISHPPWDNFLIHQGTKILFCGYTHTHTHTHTHATQSERLGSPINKKYKHCTREHVLRAPYVRCLKLRSKRQEGHNQKAGRELGVCVCVCVCVCVRVLLTPVMTAWLTYVTTASGIMYTYLPSGSLLRSISRQKDEPSISNTVTGAHVLSHTATPGIKARPSLEHTWAETWGRAATNAAAGSSRLQAVLQQLLPWTRCEGGH